MFTARYELNTFTNSTLCPHSVFMCFVWISEKAAIISFYSVNWLVFIIETECVYCAVRAEYLNIIRLILVCKFKAASRRRLIVESGFDPRSVRVIFVVDKAAFGQVFLRVLSFSSVSIIPPLLHTNLHLHAVLTRTKGRSLGTFQKAMLPQKSKRIG